MPRTRKQRGGSQALFDAVTANDIERVRQELAKPGVNVNWSLSTLLSDTALHEAIKHGYTEICRLLLDVPGIDVNVLNYARRSPLHEAIRRNNMTVIRLLLSHPGINVNSRDNYNQTPLHYASMYPSENVEAVRLLLAVPGIDVNATDRARASPLDNALLREIQQLLINAGGVRTRIVRVNIDEPENDENILPNAPMPGGIAYQIHNAFRNVKVDELIQYFESIVGEKRIPGDFNTYLIDSLRSFNSDRSASIETQLNAIYDQHLRTMVFGPGYKELCFYTIEYVKTQSAMFQQNYVNAYAVDCSQAYNGAGGMTCGKGAMERIVISLEAAIASVDMTAEYRRLLYLIDDRRYPNPNAETPIDYSTFLSDFGSVCSGLHANATDRVAFKLCMQQKLQEELGLRYNEAAVSAVLDEYISNLGIYSNLTGGRRTYRKRQHKKRKTRARARAYRKRA